MWKVKGFSLGAVSEGLTLSPEGSSKYELFRYLTSQVQKIYSVYEMVSEFPVGPLLILVYFHSMMLCKDRCPQCELQFDLSGHGFGMMPPQFRDMWLRPEYWMTFKHNMCQSQHQIDLVPYDK